MNKTASYTAGVEDGMAKVSFTGRAALGMGALGALGSALPGAVGGAAAAGEGRRLEGAAKGALVGTLAGGLAGAGLGTGSALYLKKKMSKMTQGEAEKLRRSMGLV